VTIIGEASRDGRCPCGADLQLGNLFCSPDCEPDLIADPDDPWGFIQRQSATELTRMAETDCLDPWLATS
jgi:hypothetical protein